MNAFEFREDFCTKRILPFPIGRLVIGGQETSEIVRIALLPDGIHLSIPKSAMEKFVHVFDDSVVEFVGLGETNVGA